MAVVLLVSKPLGPPWNDGSKNLARDLAEGMRRHLPRALVTQTGWRPRRGQVEPIGRHTALATLAHLATGPRPDLWHFFFAPNPRTSLAARALGRARRVPSVHTVCSRPRELRAAQRLLFADRTVVLSRATEVALESVGARVLRIPPATPALAPLDAAARRETRRALGLPLEAPLLVYPGDLEHGEGAARILAAHARMRTETWLVMACRTKTRAAREAERRLRTESGPRVTWVGETGAIHALLGAADAVALPSTDLYAKVDLPLVLIEAMWLARPVLVAADSPAAELAEDGAALAVEPHPDAIAAALDDLADDGAKRAAQGALARRAAQSRYDVAAMAAAYERLYDELAGAPA
ncbi:MAG: glycosyltransferase family 4 protein [Sandaracinaceae bacterium]|nr:glycosyltransferase family 4 protein [Sandaracinaceae bacterium]